jgi:flagellar motor switch protein FliM
MLTRQLQTAEVELATTLGDTRLPLSEVIRLKTGDVIPIHIDDTVLALVDGVPLLEARYGVQNGQYALKVEKFLAEDNP